MHRFLHIGVNLVGVGPHHDGPFEYYVRSLLGRLAHSERARITLFCDATQTDFLGQLPVRVVGTPSGRTRWSLRDRPHRLAASLNAEAVDIVWSPAQVHAPLLPRTLPHVVTVHHLRQHWLPRHYTSWERLRAHAGVASTVVSARRLIATSQFTQKTLVRTYRAPERKVVTIHEGACAPVSGRASVLAETLHKFGLCPPFFVYPAVDAPHKNHRRLVESFARFLERTESPSRLVLWGARDRTWRHAAQIISALGMDDRVIHLGELASQEANDLITSATALVFPSEGEGFGRPIIDAQLRGTPVIFADHASNSEVAGAGGVLVAPRDIEGWARAFERVTVDRGLGERLVRKGAENAARFCWDRAAEQTLGVLRQAAAAARRSPARKG